MFNTTTGEYSPFVKEEKTTGDVNSNFSIKADQQGLSAGNAGYNFLAEYEEKFIVFHTKEYKHLTELQMDNLKDILWTIVKGRQGEGKKSENNYYVCNQDEPYAQKVIDIILEGETEKLKAKKL